MLWDLWSEDTYVKYLVEQEKISMNLGHYSNTIYIVTKTTTVT